jgi:hypothetical protein
MFTEDDKPLTQLIEPSLFSSFPSLTSFGFSRWCTMRGWDWSFLIGSTPSARLPPLRHLEINLMTRMNNDDAALLRMLNVYSSTLVTLVLSVHADHPVLDIVRASLACQRLESLTLCMQGKASPWSVNDLAALRPSASLRSLSLFGFHHLTDAQVVTLVSACPGLQSLTLHMMPHVSLSILPAIGRVCRQLRSLHLVDVSSSLFQSAPATERMSGQVTVGAETRRGGKKGRRKGIESAHSEADDSSTSSSSASDPLFPHLSDLFLEAWDPRGVSPPYSTSVLESLV